MSELRPQRRSRRIAMTDAERDEFLADERVCRVASVGPDGPHATPLWFVWDGTFLWLYSIVRSRRWADLAADPRIGVVVDGGVAYEELRGVELTGTVEAVGDVPRTGGPDPVLEPVERRFARKYAGDSVPVGGPEELYHDGRHGWLRVTPGKIVSWDFRKLASL
jgi:hypothetical protein